MKENFMGDTMAAVTAQRSRKREHGKGNHPDCWFEENQRRSKNKKSQRKKTRKRSQRKITPKKLHPFPQVHPPKRGHNFSPMTSGPHSEDGPPAPGRHQGRVCHVVRHACSALGARRAASSDGRGRVSKRAKGGSGNIQHLPTLFVLILVCERLQLKEIMGMCLPPSARASRFAASQGATHHAAARGLQQPSEEPNRGQRHQQRQKRHGHQPSDKSPSLSKQELPKKGGLGGGEAWNPRKPSFQLRESPLHRGSRSSKVPAERSQAEARGGAPRPLAMAGAQFSKSPVKASQ